jgi:hypothetical protein
MRRGELRDRLRIGRISRIKRVLPRGQLEANSSDLVTDTIGERCRRFSSSRAGSMSTFRSTLRLAVTLAVVLAARPGLGRDWFVDNIGGSDAFDGLSSDRPGGLAGPVKTIRRALRLAGPSDTVHLANHGEPYYESLDLTGRRASGSEAKPFTIEGHGAIVSGARSIPPQAWSLYRGRIWKMTPFRKGHYQLLLSHAALPEVSCPRSARSPPKLEPGQWCVWNGTMYFHALDQIGGSPLDLPLAFAYDSVGLTLYDVRHVLVRDITFRHFRQDGVNAHDLAKYVILDTVKLLENGRTGLTVAGSSLVGVKDSALGGNRVAQLLNSERAQTELINSVLDDRPGERLRIDGGHVLIDGDEVMP